MTILYTIYNNMTFVLNLTNAITLHAITLSNVITVLHFLVILSHKIIFIAIPNCNFATDINCNIHL